MLNIEASKMLWLLFTLALVAIIYNYLNKSMKYWTKHGVKQTNPYPIAGDNWATLLRTRSSADILKNVYNIAPKTRYVGMYQFGTPTLVLKDPELIKQITIKDFDNFMNHRAAFSEKSEPLLGRNLSSLTGKRWRDMRATLSPSFTSSKMRTMFTLMTEQAESFTKYFVKQDKDLIEIEMKDAFARFTNDVIATTAFGIEVNSLEERNNEFFLMGKDATNFTGWWKNLKFFGFLIIPSLYKYLNISFLGAHVSNFFLKIVKETIKAREENHIVRPDMIHLLMEARKGNVKTEEIEAIDTGFATVEESNIGKAKVNITLDDMDIAAQALVFFFAGFDAVSGFMCFTSYELAVNSDVQKRLREEIELTLKENNGKITYDALLGMKYLDMVLTEGLRKWPNAVVTDRICTKPYTIEAKYPDEVPVHLKVNDLLMIPIVALHHDPKYYPNPDKFDPERFSDENKANIKPYTYLPFGVGPRNCIGSRFALLETKAILFHLLHHFEIVPTEKTKIPLEVSKKSFNLTSEGGFWFGLKRINN